MIVDWIPTWVSVGDVLRIITNEDKQCDVLVYKWQYEYIYNDDFDKRYTRNVIQYKQQKNKNKKKIRFSKCKQNKNTLVDHVLLVPIHKHDNGKSYFGWPELARLDRILAIQHFRFNDLHQFKSKYPVEHNHVYTNYIIEDELPQEILDKLETKYPKYHKYDQHLIPVPIALYSDHFSMNVNKMISKGVLRLKYLFGNKYVNNKLCNIPIIFVYDKSVDKKSLIKVINHIFKDSVSSAWIHQNHKFQTQICALINDSQERVQYANILCNNATVNCCATCSIEIFNVLPRYAHENKIILTEQHEFKVARDSSEYDPDLTLNTNSDTDASEYELYDDQIQDDSLEKSARDIETAFWIDHDLNEFDDLIIRYHSFYCRGNWGITEIKHLLTKIPNHELNKYAFNYPHNNILLNKLLPNVDINKLFVNDIAHSFSNMSKQIIADLLQLCNLSEQKYLLTYIERFAKIDEYDITKLVQHENIMILEILSMAILAFQYKYPNHVLCQYIRYFAFISIYIIIIQYGDPIDYPIIKIAVIVHSFIILISDLVHKQKKKSSITAVTLHQFISFTIKTLFCYGSLKLYTTSPMERGMTEIRQILNKSFNKSINQCIINIFRRRNMYRVLSNCMKFSINHDLAYPYRYIWNENGELHVGINIINLKNSHMILGPNNKSVSITNSAKSKIKTINNKTYYSKLNVSEFENRLDSTNYYKTLKYYPNCWKTNEYYIFEIENQDESVIGYLINIYTQNGSTFIGDFKIFNESTTIVKNGYKKIIPTNQVISMILDNTPHHCIVYNIKNLYLLHPVSYAQRTKIIYIDFMWNYIVQESHYQ